MGRFLEKAQKKSKEQLKIAIWLDSEGSTEHAIDETKARLAVISKVEIEFRDISEFNRTYAKLRGRGGFSL